MRRKLHTRRGRQRYALRMATVEPVFGQIKQGRGFRQFLLRGLAKVNGEWSLICTGHNLLKLFRFGLPANIGGPESGIRKFAHSIGCPQSRRSQNQPPRHASRNLSPQSSDGLLNQSQGEMRRVMR